MAIAFPRRLARLGGAVGKSHRACSPSHLCRWFSAEIGSLNATDGELITAIVNPAHGVPEGRRAALVRSGHLSRMGDFGEAMTVRQLIDIVAFQHSRDRVVPLPPAYVQ